MKYYKCSRCGNILAVIEDGDAVPECCQKTMDLLKSSPQDDAHMIMIDEKDVSLDTKKVRVCIGKDKLHPMDTHHLINFITLITDKGNYTHFFKPGNIPCAKFFINIDEKILAINLYCNVHGLYELNK